VVRAYAGYKYKKVYLKDKNKWGYSLYFNIIWLQVAIDFRSIAKYFYPSPIVAGYHESS
jgi:hypothetical protein